MAAFPARDWEAFMDHWARIIRDEAATALAVIVDSKVAGHIGCWIGDGQRQVGYWLGKEYWGRGLATRMLAQFLQRVPERPLYARAAAHNIASIRVLEKCGFVPSRIRSAAGEEHIDAVEERTFVIET